MPCMNNAQLNGIRQMHAVSQPVRRETYRIVQWQNGRWAVVMFGLSRYQARQLVPSVSGGKIIRD